MVCRMLRPVTCAIQPQLQENRTSADKIGVLDDEHINDECAVHVLKCYKYMQVIISFHYCVRIRILPCVYLVKIMWNSDLIILNQNCTVHKCLN